MQKFMFDRLNFDHGSGYELEHPPEPTFTLAELESARAEGVVQGRNAALKESQESRDQKIVELTQKISAAVTQMTTAEQSRDGMYQQESARLSAALFQRVFPVLKTLIGVDQIIENIRSVMATLDDKAAIGIEVSTDDLTEISDRLRPLMMQHEGQMAILAQPDLTAGSCRLKWHEGGMIQNPDETAEKLLATLRGMLKDAIEK